MIVSLRKGREHGYFHVLADRKRAGNVFVSYPKKPSRPHISIHLNQGMRGLGIGRQAISLATEKSGHRKLFAMIAKKNRASRSAFGHAGYKDVTRKGIDRQIVMRWDRR